MRPSRPCGIKPRSCPSTTIFWFCFHCSAKIVPRTYIPPAGSGGRLVSSIYFNGYIQPFVWPIGPLNKPTRIQVGRCWTGITSSTSSPISFSDYYFKPNCDFRHHCSVCQTLYPFFFNNFRAAPLARQTFSDQN